MALRICLRLAAPAREHRGDCFGEPGGDAGQSRFATRLPADESAASLAKPLFGRTLKGTNRSMRVTLRLLGIALSAVLMLTAGKVAASEYDSVFERLLFNPGDPALNIRYAELAEENGELRKALGAYERVLASDPSHRHARRHYNRVKNLLQPTVTQVTVDLGVSFETNPRQLTDIPQRESDIGFDAGFHIFDERTWLNHRWRTVGLAHTDWQADVSDLNDLLLSAWTGPVFNLGKTRLHVAPGAEIAFLDREHLYTDALARATFERVMGGATQTLSAIATYRNGEAFNAADGWIFQVSARLSKYQLLLPGDAFYLIPRFRYNEPTGRGDGRVFAGPLFPGDFYEVGSRAEYFVPALDNAIYVGAGFGAHYRDYNQNIAFGPGQREDWMLEPSAHLIVPNVLGRNGDLRFDYQFQYNDSNDATQDFENHVVGVRSIKRF